MPAFDDFKELPCPSIYNDKHSFSGTGALWTQAKEQRATRSAPKGQHVCLTRLGISNQQQKETIQGVQPSKEASQSRQESVVKAMMAVNHLVKLTTH
jgi:hypothetical protein